MTTCAACKHLSDDICGKYGRRPPAGFAERCRHYSFYPSRPVEVAPEAPQRQECDGCPQYDDGWCLQLDHPEWKYNFVRIKEGMECPRK